MVSSRVSCQSTAGVAIAASLSRAGRSRRLDAHHPTMWSAAERRMRQVKDPGGGARDDCWMQTGWPRWGKMEGWSDVGAHRGGGHGT